MRNRALIGSLLIAALTLLLSVVAVGQSSSTSSSSASSIGGTAEVRLGGLTFETGSRVALEIVKEGSSNCFGGSVTVSRLALIDGDGNVVSSQRVSPAARIDAWIGRLHLVDEMGQPLPMGRYEIAVTTTAGAFVAEIEIVPTSRFYGLGSYSASASVCGLSLRVYRLLTELDDGLQLTLRVGDRLMVALEGNATTGYTWMNTVEAEYAVLLETEEMEYRPDSDLLGAGGAFLFRYMARDVGPQWFRFAYQRPWESVQPQRVVSYTVEVR